MIALLHWLGYGVMLAALAYYFITTLQWYSYRLERAILHHTKVQWHFIYFLIPYALYELLSMMPPFGFVLSLGFVALLFKWHKGLDKPLVVTGRVKRFFVALLFFALFFALISRGTHALLLPLLAAWFASAAFEKLLFAGFKRKAAETLASRKELIVVGVTASYGKTSIKNFIAHLLGAKYRTYATPRSVNTLGGVMKDINDDLPEDTQVYVVEMGARGEGDIAEIAEFVNPHVAVVGKIGPAHIEYFKTLENIRNTKMEILRSKRLEKAFVHESAKVNPDEKVETYGKGEGDEAQLAPMHRIGAIEVDLEKTCFALDGTRFCASILGAFNAENLAVAILVARHLDIDDEAIAERLSTLQPVAHRLQRIDAGGKLILDDSFNGNIDGMMASFDLASTYKGRKVVITPGLVEADDTLNEEVAKRANEVFDLVIVTGDLNYAIFKKYVDSDKLLKLESKAEMERMLAERTRGGDLVLFANDAPSFV